MALYPRLVEQRVAAAMSDTRVVLIVGPGLLGKTTLAKKFAAQAMEYYTLDNATTLDAARQDPVCFVRGINRAVIDEIQRAPELLLAIKESVDTDRRPGRFLLTGSAIHDLAMRDGRARRADGGGSIASARAKGDRNCQ